MWRFATPLTQHCRAVEAQRRESPATDDLNWHVLVIDRAWLAR